VGGTQHQSILVLGSDYLQADGESVAGKTAGYARSGLLGQIERVTERGPARPAPVRPAFGHLATNLEGGDRHRRAQQKIVRFVELAHADAQLAATAVCFQVLQRGVARALVRYLDEAGIHEFPKPLVEGSQRVRGGREPVDFEDVDGIFEAGSSFLHPGPHLLERLSRAFYGPFHLGIHVCVPEVGAESDPQPFNAPLDSLQVIYVLGKADQSRASGSAITSSISAASATVEVIGPAWESVPYGLGGHSGMRP
jgi:hypothetical protein